MLYLIFKLLQYVIAFLNVISGELPEGHFVHVVADLLHLSVHHTNIEYELNQILCGLGELTFLIV